MAGFKSPVFDCPSFLNSLKNDAELADRLVATQFSPGREAVFQEPSEALDPALRDLLIQKGVFKLYRHQAQAYDAAQRGESFTVITPTASGKTLTYLMPLASRLLWEPEAKALVLFPIKALAQDQLGIVQDWLNGLPHSANPEAPKKGRGKGNGGFRAAIYDGDTSSYQRGKLKEDPPSVVISNPDMLHMGLLPFHAGWGKFLSQLRLVVVDEAHSYRGIFGAHVAMILRRLRRLCQFYGSQPQFLFLSATIANPQEFSSQLSGLQPKIISENGAPSGERYFSLWNPQASPYREATELFSRLLKKGFKSIAFTKARKITELMSRWTTQSWPDLARRFRSYRAGYLPKERRAIEQQLFSGELDGVISTSALELGIDVGGLDACILVGYPGTMISTLQRAGRVGRSGQSSLVFLIGLQDAMDQYFMRHPDSFFSKPTEHALIPIENRVILEEHLQAAAEELPLGPNDTAFFGKQLLAQCERLWKSGLLKKSHQEAYHPAQRGVARRVNIRSAGDGFSIEVSSAGKQRIIGRIEVPRVYRDCHPGAIYLHAGGQYQVLSLDENLKRVEVQETEVDFYTEPRGEDKIEILQVKKRQDFGHVSWCFGEVQASEQVKGYVKKHISSQEILSEHPLEMPVHTYQTQAAWWELPNEWRKEFAPLGLDFAGAIHALEHSQIALLPLFVLCDRWDLGGVSYWAQPQLDRPAIFVYDGHPGGAALVEKGFEIVREWLEAVERMLAACPCEDGCPACVQSPKCGNGNKPLDKQGARELVRRLLPNFKEKKSGPQLGALETERIPKDSAPRDHETNKVGPNPMTGSALKAVAGEEKQAAWKRLITRVSVLSGEDQRVEGANATTTTQPSHPQRLKLDPQIHNIVFFDLETQYLAAEVGGWDNKAAMRLSVAVTYSSRLGKFRQYTEGSVAQLLEELKGADLVVGFNQKNFDYAVLQAYGDGSLHQLPSLDLLEEVSRSLGRRLKLDRLAKATLNHAKSADGVQAVTWFREGRLAELLEYCQQDVALTKELWEFGRKYGYLLYEDQSQLMRVAVDW